MLRTTTIAAAALALTAAPALAGNCNYGAKATTAQTAPAYSVAPATAQTYSTPTYQDFATTAPAPVYADARPDIVDTAASAGQFNTLIAAAQAAGLVETLKGPGPLTVFAPTDAAFAALPEGTVESLLQPQNRDQLAAVLTYHVVPGKVMSGDLAGQQVSPTTVQGGTLDVDGTSGVTVNGANVVQADIETSNGVIHVIDSVLLPQ